jgi:hypothetical protein
MSRFRINHPAPCDTVMSDFLLAQGTGDPAIRNIIGILWDASGSLVAVAPAMFGTPDWAIAFEDYEPGNGYCLEVIDACSRQLLACVCPFDAVPSDGRGPTVWYPAAGANLYRNLSSYGSSPGLNPVEGQVTGPNGNTPWVDQSQGPPNTAYWILTFANVPLNANPTSILTVREKANPANSTSVPNLTIS